MVVTSVEMSMMPIEPDVGEASIVSGVVCYIFGLVAA